MSVAPNNSLFVFRRRRFVGFNAAARSKPNRWFCSSPLFAPPKNKKRRGNPAIVAIHRQPLTGFSRASSMRALSRMILLTFACVSLQAADTDVEKLASANAAFGFNLMKQVVGEQPDANV